MSLPSTMQLTYLKTAEYYLSPSYVSDDDGNWDPHTLFKPYCEAVALAQSYLNIIKIDFENKQQQNILAVALNIVMNREITDPAESKIAIDLKNRQYNSFVNVVQPLKDTVETCDPAVNLLSIVGNKATEIATFAGRNIFSCMTQEPNPISLGEVERAWPNGVPTNVAVELINMNISKEVYIYLYKQTIQGLEAVEGTVKTIEKSIVSLAERQDSLHEIVAGNQPGIPTQAGSSENLPQSNSPNDFSQKNKSENQAQSGSSVNPPKSDTSNETLNVKAATRLAIDCSKIISIYFQLQSVNKEHQRETRVLLKAFDRISEHLELKVSIETFSQKSPNEIVDFFLREGKPRNLVDEARMIAKVSEDIRRESDQLTREIKHCLENKENFDAMSKDLRMLNRRIKNFYENKIRRLEESTSFLGTIQLGIAFCAAISLPVSGPFAMSTAAASCATNIAQSHYQDKRGKYYERLQQHLDIEQKRAQILGYHSDANISKLIALQETKREELGYIIANRAFIAPQTYLTLLRDSIQWLQEDTEKKKKQIVDNEENIKKYENRNQNLNTKKFNAKKSKEKHEIDEKMQDNKVQIELWKINNHDLSVVITNNERTLEVAKQELALAEYVAPIANYRAGLLKKAIEEARDEKDDRFKKEVDNVFHTLKAIREEGYQQRHMVFNSLSPIGNELQFFSQEFDKLRFLRNAPEFLKLAQNIDGFRNDVLTIKDFIDFSQEIAKEYNIPIGLLGGDYATKFQILINDCKNLTLDFDLPLKEFREKIGMDNFLTQFVCPFLGANGKALAVVHSLYMLSHTRKDPTISAIAKMFEEDMKKQKELLQKHLEIIIKQTDRLSEQNDKLSCELKESIKIIVAQMTEENQMIVGHINAGLFYEFESKINTLKWEIIRKGKLSKHLDNFSLLNDSHHNGTRVMEAASAEGVLRTDLRWVVKRPTYYSGFLFQQVTKSQPTKSPEVLSSLILFQTLTEQVLKLQDQISPTEIGACKQFIGRALKEIRRFQILLVFPVKQIVNALASKRELFERFRDNLNHVCKLELKENKLKLEKARETFDANKKALSETIGWNKFQISHLLYRKGFSIREIQRKASVKWSTYEGEYNNRTSKYISIDSLSASDFNGDHVSTHSQRDFSFSATDVNYVYFFGKKANKFDGSPFSDGYFTRGESILNQERMFPKNSIKLDTPILNVANKVLLNLSINCENSSRLLTTRIYSTKITASIEPNSYLSEIDLKRITRFVPRDEIDYNARVKAMVEETVNKVTNPDAKFEETEQLLPSKEGSFIPLIFPKKLIESSMKCFEDTQLHVQSLDIGTLLPASYDFNFHENRNKFELTIQIYIEYRDSNKPTKQFCECVVAEFDRDTVDAFRDIRSYFYIEKGLLSNKKVHTDFDVITERNYQEFLIQAMYCGKYGLGLPGRFTYRIESGEIVVPDERNFPGLYPLFADFPSSMKSYDSQKIEKDPVLIWKESFVENVDTSPFKDNKNFTGMPFRFRYNPETFLNVKSEIIVELKRLQESKEFKAYRYDYQILQALIQMNYEMDEEELKKNMYHFLRLPSPEDLSLIHMEWEQSAGDPSLQINEFEIACGTKKLENVLLDLARRLCVWKKQLEDTGSGTVSSINVGEGAKVSELINTPAVVKRSFQGKSHDNTQKKDSPEMDREIPEVKREHLNKGVANVSIGITNNGNDCFLISAMQLLFHCDIYNSLIDQKNKNPLESKSNKWFKEFEVFNNKYRAADRKLQVDQFRELLGFSAKGQEDAAEAIHKILKFYKADSLGSKFIFRRKIRKSEAKSIYPESRPTKEYSQIDQENCINSPAILVTLEVEINEKNATFQGQLDQFFSPKVNHSSFVFLDTNKSFFQTTSFEEQCQPKELKDYLIVSLKRFNQNGEKNNVKIHFENGECSIGNKKYRLQGFIEHVVIKQGMGHYIAYCQTGNDWHCYDDNNTPMSRNYNEVLKAAESAYVISLIAI